MAREENPAFLIPAAAFAAGMLAGSAATFRGVGGNPMGGGEYVELEDVEGAIILFSADDPTSFLDRALAQSINVATGSSGYSHAALHCGLVDPEGRVLVAESRGMKGTRLVPLDEYGRRDIAFIPLEPTETNFARNKALRMVERKTPYRGKKGGLTCSEFVVHCLPKRLKNEVGLKDDDFVTPNQIARAFGVPLPRAANPAPDTRKLARKLLR